MNEFVHVDVLDAIATVSLQRASRRNAVNQQMMRELIDVTQRLNENTAVRAVIVRAEGEDFSVGADLKDSSGFSGDDSLLAARRNAEQGAHMMRALRDIPQPTICAVQGIATGAGACIACACDFRIAADNVRMGFGEVRIGMNLMWNAIPYIVELVGPARAKKLVMSGKLMPAATLLGWGMLDEVCAIGDLANQAEALAKEYAALPPIAVQMIKRSVNRYSQALGEAVMHMDTDQWLLTTRTDDFNESISAFHDKRTPTLTGN